MKKYYGRTMTGLTMAAVLAAGMFSAVPAMADGTLTANFYTDADTVYESEEFESGSRVTVPETDPEQEGSYFAGWYEDEDCTVEYSSLTKYTEDQNFYAKWLNINTFEAEDTQLTGLDYDSDETGTVDELGNKKGQGYSSNVAGKNLIVQSSQASNGEYVSNLYINGSYLEFEINSDAAVDDAKLYLVLSCEFTDMTLTPDNFVVEVNGEAVDYADIELTGADLDNDLASATRRDFTTHYISDISLNEGENSIKLIVNNDTHPFETGTVNALAPMVDAIQVYSESALTMTTYEN